ncbi:MAG: nuclear transport factor 2 family protein [Dehalococcoidales bacterium]|nr:nuclear transport factor 2 family protein [Dehalococcoidales bacterium]
MNTEEMEARIKTLEQQLRTVMDIQEIERLQRIYGYYLEHWMADEIIDLFSDGPDAGLEWPEGAYKGKEGVRRYFSSMEKPDPEFLHQLMQLSPVIDVSPDGKTARGRWYSFGGVSVPRGGGVGQSFISGTYENAYVKENGKWKIQRIRWHMNFSAKPGEGWVKPERVAAMDPNAEFEGPKPDVPDTRFALAYPSGHIFPFHFNHPVTGKKTSEEQKNETMKKLSSGK